MDDMRDGESIDTDTVVQQPTPPASDSQRISGSTEAHSHLEQHPRQMDIEKEAPPSGDMMSPVSSEDKREDSEQPEQAALPSVYSDCYLSKSYEFSNVRVCLPYIPLLSSW
jgi:hypothetical protein